MKRKRLQEEITLREYVNGYGDSRDMSRLITALVRAVREDAVNKATTFLHGADYRHSNEDWLLKEIAAAIRGKK